MKKETLTALHKKGWSNDAIKEAERIIDSRKLKDKSRSFHSSTRILYWSVIFLIIIGNMVISLVLIPFLIVMNRTMVDLIAIIAGLGFGALFNLVMLDIDQLEQKHHITAGILIPVLALINIAAITSIANAINDFFVISNVRADPVMTSALYVIAFITPYLWSVFVRKKIDIGYKGKLTGLKESQKAFEEEY